MALHLILDTETTTIPGARLIAGDDAQKARNISTNMPIVYDIGWVIIDDNGTIVRQASYLVKETFNEESRMEAYYADRWQGYIEDAENGVICLADWASIIDQLKKDCAECADVGAYNARFDFHKAIPYTDVYLANKSDSAWFESELRKAREFAENPPGHKEADEACFYHLTEQSVWEFKDFNIPAIDIWNMACKTFLDTPDYKAWSIREGMYTSSAVYFSTNAENCYRFLLGDNGWNEDHTALSDAKIEAKIYNEIVRRYGHTACITIMPCMKLGRTVDFVDKNRVYFSLTDINNLSSALNNYYKNNCQTKSSWSSQVNNLITKLDNIRKDFESMKNFAVALLYMNYRTGASLNRIISISIPLGLTQEEEDEAITDAIASETSTEWLGMVFDSVIRVTERK